MFDRPQLGDNAIVVSLDFGGFDIKEDISEIKQLTVSAGFNVSELVASKRSTPHTKYFIGSGKMEEINWTNEDVNNFLKYFIKKQEIKFPEIAMPLRTIIAGTDNTPSIGSIIFIIGIEVVRKRISVILE